MSKQTLINRLCNEYGMTENEMLEEYGMDSIIPAICKYCYATYEYEPDARNFYCDECGEQSVSSLLVLMGVI